MVITHTDGTEITTVDHAVTKTELQADGSWRTTVKPAPVDRKAFLQANYPKTISDVSKEWLSELLQKKLTAHSVLKVLDAGVTSDAAIFALEYAAGEGRRGRCCHSGSPGLSFSLRQGISAYIMTANCTGLQNDSTSLVQARAAQRPSA
jgi:hypothetical protein